MLSRGLIHAVALDRAEQKCGGPACRHGWPRAQVPCGWCQDVARVRPTTHTRPSSPQTLVPSAEAVMVQTKPTVRAYPPTKNRTRGAPIHTKRLQARSPPKMTIAQ